MWFVLLDERAVCFCCSLIRYIVQLDLTQLSYLTFTSDSPTHTTTHYYSYTVIFDSRGRVNNACSSAHNTLLQQTTSTVVQSNSGCTERSQLRHSVASAIKPRHVGISRLLQRMR